MKGTETPEQVKLEIEKLKYCEEVEVLEYLKHPSIVFIVKVTFWTRVQCLFFPRYYRTLKIEVELILSKAIGAQIEYNLVFKL